MLLLGSTSLGLLPSLIWHCLSIEKVVEKIFRSNKVTLEMVTVLMTTSTASLLLPLICLFTAYLIVYASFFSVWKTCHRCIYLFECVCSFGGWVLIGVYFHGSTLECLLEVTLCAWSLNVQHLVVVLAFYDIITNLNIVLTIRSLVFNCRCALLLLGCGWWFWGCWFRGWSTSELLPKVIESL